MFWDFLSDPDNQKTLSFLGGGAAVVISGLWTAFLVLRKKPEAPKPPAPPRPTQNITAGDGLAAMGDVLVEGNVTIQKTTFPRSAIALGVVGLLLLGAGFLLPSGDCTISSVTSGGDLNAGNITITGGTGSDGC